MITQLPQLLLKRAVDLVASIFILLFASPVLLLTAVWVRFALGKPITYRQRRPGLKGKPFWMVKFRTMTNERDQNGTLLPDEARLTRSGILIRKYSLDELPQLWNVLKGEMSMVGPRPLLMQYLPRYSIRQATRHGVKPGITGWAQVNGRNSLSWGEKLELDAWYVENWSIWLDFRILWRTLSVVLRSRGVTSSDHATMSEFNPREFSQE